MRRRPLPRRGAGLAVVAVMALACSGGGGGADAPAGGGGEPAWWSMEQLDADWVAYERQRQLFVDGPFPLATMPVEVTCPDDATCDGRSGFDIGGSFYHTTGAELATAQLDVDGPVASLPIGDVYVVAGVEPAAYLVVEQPGRWLMLQTYDLPSGTTTRQRAIELQEARCSIQSVAGAVAPATDCDDPTVSWLIDEQPGPWTVVDPPALSDVRVHRREPTPDTLDRVRQALGAGSEAAEVRTSFGPAAAAGPYTAADETLASLPGSWCVDTARSGCRSGYRVGSSGPARVDYTVIAQRPTPGPESRLETFYIHGSVELIEGAGWWFTESGPTAVHQNGSGQVGRADADQRFDGCCDVTAGQL